MVKYEEVGGKCCATETINVNLECKPRDTTEICMSKFTNGGQGTAPRSGGYLKNTAGTRIKAGEVIPESIRIGLAEESIFVKDDYNCNHDIDTGSCLANTVGWFNCKKAHPRVMDDVGCSGLMAPIYRHPLPGEIDEKGSNVLVNQCEGGALNSANEGASTYVSRDTVMSGCELNISGPDCELNATIAGDFGPAGNTPPTEPDVLNDPGDYPFYKCFNSCGKSYYGWTPTLNAGDSGTRGDGTVHQPPTRTTAHRGNESLEGYGLCEQVLNDLGSLPNKCAGEPYLQSQGDAICAPIRERWVRGHNRGIYTENLEYGDFHTNVEDYKEGGKPDQGSAWYSSDIGPDGTELFQAESLGYWAHMATEQENIGYIPCDATYVTMGDDPPQDIIRQADCTQGGIKDTCYGSTCNEGTPKPNPHKIACRWNGTTRDDTHCQQQCCTPDPSPSSASDPDAEPDGTLDWDNLSWDNLSGTTQVVIVIVLFVGAGVLVKTFFFSKKERRGDTDWASLSSSGSSSSGRSSSSSSGRGSSSSSGRGSSSSSGRGSSSDLDRSIEAKQPEQSKAFLAHV